MFKKLCLLTVLMAMVAVTANVAQARVVTENFSGDGDRILDIKGPGNETTVSTFDSGLTWGGYDNYMTTNTRTQNVTANGTLTFSSRIVGDTPGSYGYTMFETLDITGATIDFDAENNRIDVATDVKLLLRAGGTWYLSETVVSVLDAVQSERQPYSFDPATATWDELDKTTNLMLDALADGDETDVNGLSTSVTLTTELADVTGGGFLHASDPGGNNALRIDEVIWKSEPWISIGGDAVDEEWTHRITLPGSYTPPGMQFVEGRQDDGWNSINNVDASDLGMTWTWTVTDYVGATDPGTAMSAVEFERKAGNYGIDENAIDPNIHFLYKGTYTLEIEADNGSKTDVATIINYVIENRAPRVTAFGNLNRTRYDGATITLNPGCQDENYPLDVALTTQHIRQITGPTPVSFFYNGHSTGWTGVTSVGSFVGIGKNHTMIPSREPEDPNVTFPVGFVGEYKFIAHAYDGDLWSWQGDRDPNKIVTVTVRDNQAMTAISAGGDTLGVKNRDIPLAGSITDPDFEGTIGDDDVTTRPENNAILWEVVSGPGGAGVVFGDETTLNSTVSFNTAGDYTLKLTVTETSLSTGVIVMEDTVDITIFSAKVKVKTIKPSDDTWVRSGGGGPPRNDEKNYGGEVELNTRGGTGGGNRKVYVKFDLNKLPGVVKKTAAKFSIMSSNSTNNDANTLIEAATYRDEIEWFEGNGKQDTNAALYPDTTGVGLYQASPARPVTGAVLDWYEPRVTGKWGNNTRLTFDVSDMVIGLDNKVTFRINHRHSSSSKKMHSKEAGLDEDGIEQSPLLTVAYDPNEPFLPTPYDGALQVPVTIAELGWKLFGADKDTEESEVFFGTDPSPSVSIGTVSKLDAPNHMTDPNMVFDLSAHVTLPLELATTYYWYVKPTYGNPSQIYNFKTTDPPVNTNPVDGDGSVNPGNPLDVTFEWINEADTFDLHISQTMQDVNSLNGNALLKAGIVGNEWLAEHDLIEFILTGDTDWGGIEEVYYWRVVAHSESGPDSSSEMSSFTVNNVDRIDNFGSEGYPADYYATVVEGSEYENYKSTWTAVNATIEALNNNDADPNNDGRANDGGSSLRLEYDDATGLSTAKCVFVESRDWSSAVTRASMKIQLHGHPDNDMEVVTVTVEDTTTATDSVTIPVDDDDLIDAMNRESWNGYIDVDVALPTGIDLSSVAGYSISVGDGSGTESGILWIDTVTVRGIRCLTKKVPYYFTNGDCAADVNEVEVLADKWLLDITPTTTTVNAAGSAPTGLLFHHTFDGGAYNGTDTFTGVFGNVLNQSWGNSASTDPVQSTDVYTGSGYLSGNTHSMQVDGTQRMQTTSFPGGLPTGSATLSIWVKPDKASDNFRSGNNYGTLNGQRPWRMRAFGTTYWRLNAFDNDGDVQMGGPGVDGVSEDVDVRALEETWFHIAYVHDYDNLSNSIYVNGLMLDEQTEIEDMLPFPPTVQRMRIPHNATNNGFHGLIDEVRIYNVALTHEQVLYLADQASVEQPVFTVGGAGDINDDLVFNMADLAELSAGYHKDGTLWP